MVNLSDILLENQEIIDFLKRDLRLQEIYQEIIYQKVIDRAAQARDLTVAPEELQAEIDRICYERRFDHPTKLLAWLAEQRSSLGDLEQRIREHLLEKKLASDLFSDSVQEFFADHRTEFEQVLLYKITVPYETLAQEIFYQIEEEEINFYEAAHLYNMDETYRLQCGYVGKQPRRKLNPAIAEILFNANTGEVLGPFKSTDGTYNLFLPEEFLLPELTTEIYEEILNQLFKAWLDNELEDYLRSQIGNCSD